MPVGSGSVLVLVSALLAGVIWLLEARAPTLTSAAAARWIVGWSGLSAVAVLLHLTLGERTQPVVLAVLVAAGLSATMGVVGTAQRATGGVGLARAAAEAGLIGAGVVSIFWALIGAPASPGPRVMTALTLTTLDLVLAALILRIPASTPAAPDGGYLRVTLVALAALGALAAADGLTTLELVSGSAPTGLTPTARSGAFLAAAAVPWIGVGLDRARRPGRPVTRALPYLVVGAALVAQLLVAAVHPVGLVSVSLATLLVCGLAAVQGSAFRDNRRLLRDLEASRSRLLALIENSGDVILGIDAAGRVCSANGAAVRLLHRTPAAMVGLDVATLAAGPDRARVRSALDAVAGGRRESDRVELRLAAPATGTAELRLQAVPQGVVANLSDVTEAVALRTRLDRLARFDELTGLANRSHLLDVVGGWIRAGESVGVLYCDLDGFKSVNDRFGHDCGNGVLIEAAGRLQAAVADVPAAEVLVARTGGDEFAVALLRTDPDDLPIVAERMLAAMRPTFAVADRAARVGISVGSASTRDAVPGDLNGGAAVDLLHRADVAMFAAKQTGWFRALHWDAAVQARAARRMDVAIGLRRALDSRRLTLAYQPLVRLADGVVIGVEALIRVAAGDDAPGALSGLPEVVCPAELVAAAEDTGEIIEMGQWVLTEASHQAAAWRAAGHDVVVTVNVSVRQLTADGFVASVRRVLEAAGLPAEALVMEITEGQLLSPQDAAWPAVEQLRAMGVVMAIDDFGSGYSSLAYLRRVPVRAVKLDQSLLDDLATDARARTLARAVIATARALGLLVVAEGLETLAAARVARDLGAYAGQGFAFFAALPADEVTQVLAGAPVALGLDEPVEGRAQSVRDPADGISHDETRGG